MKGFEVDPKERGILRSGLTDELIAVIDQAEEAMDRATDKTIETFKASVEARMAEFSEHDFASELKEKLEADQQVLMGELEESAKGLSSKISAVNALVAAAADGNPMLRQSLDELTVAQSGLETTLKETRKKVALVGETVAKMAVQSVKKVVTGIL